MPIKNKLRLTDDSLLMQWASGDLASNGKPIVVGAPDPDTAMYHWYVTRPSDSATGGQERHCTKTWEAAIAFALGGKKR